MGWNGPILSDSGGFQVFSLANLLKIDEDGVRFRSHIDGSEHFYTPELALEVQRALGVDIAMPLDHVVPGDADRSTALDAMARTTRWLKRCRSAAGETALFPIVQGGTHEDLRVAHTQELADLEAPGFAIGGLSVGESKASQWAMTEIVTAKLPIERPRYLMGVGSPEDLVEGVRRGIDMFDCVLPTRLGRNGGLFTEDGRVSIKGARFRAVDAPIDPDCDCECCARYSTAYLHHLFRNDELLGHRLATIHNVRYLVRLTERMRLAIAGGEFESFASSFMDRYRPADERVRTEQRRKWSERSL